ncbi:MAG: hypothetical protein ACI8P9_002815, partial [Parasphingorhabdus sp.]
MTGGIDYRASWKIDFGNTPEKSRKFTAKCASII